MITRIAHLCISVKNLDESLKFYNTALGLPTKFRFLKDNKLFGVYLEVSDGNYIELFADRKDGAGDAGISHFCLEVTSVDEMIERLSGLGIACTPRQLGADNTYQTWATDPDGTRIEFHEYTATSSQKVGGDVQVNW